MRFRWVLGIDAGPSLNNWVDWFPELKKQGYSASNVLQMLHYESC